jgi:thiol-disulfide isomerase/thioredoxin
MPPSFRSVPRWTRLLATLALALAASSFAASPGPRKPPATASHPARFALRDTAQARALLKQVAARYQTADSYLFEGQVNMWLEVGGREMTLEIPFLLAAMKPARMRTEMLSSGVSVVAVCDGQHIYNYLPRLNQYTRHDASAISTIGDQIGLAHALANGTPLERPISLATDLRMARMLDPQTLTVDGRRVRCVVVEAHYGPVPGNHLAISPDRLWIDPERKLVVRDSLQLFALAPSGDTVTTRQVSTFTRSVLNEALPESLFTFRPPPGSELVEQPHEQVSPLVGKPAQDFSIGDLDGRMRSLAEHKGKVVLLDFWATWCGPCRREMPNIAKLHRELESKGLAVVAVNVAEKPSVVSAFLTKNGYKLPIWLDLDGKVAGQYGAAGLPTLVVIDRKGSVAAHLIGLRSEEEVRAELKKAGLD